MLRWSNVADKEIFGMIIKMYRNPFTASEIFYSPYKGLELDHYSYKYYDSELFMYRILDENFIEYIEERGETDRIDNIKIPSQEDVTQGIL